MDGDLEGQVSLSVGEPVWSARNPVHDRLPVLRAAATLQRRRVPLLLSTGAPLVLGLKLADCGADPIPPAGAITKVRRDTIPASNDQVDKSGGAQATAPLVLTGINTRIAGDHVDGLVQTAWSAAE